MVAARHSSEHDMLRMFSVRYFDGGEVEHRLTPSPNSTAKHSFWSVTRLRFLA